MPPISSTSGAPPWPAVHQGAAIGEPWPVDLFAQCRFHHDDAPVERRKVPASSRAEIASHRPLNMEACETAAAVPGQMGVIKAVL